ncbi:MAG: DSD1 family PLP-dependent enzyme [SAR202 cluster bacterium]|nr:DSD1 family PLP-dependent enzyme [SAR202 cluster bacterium]
MSMPTGTRGPNEALIGKPGSRNALSTPALVLDLDIMEANIASMAEHARAHNYEVRPVAKIHKCVEVSRRQMAAGGRGPCCATLAEAEAMVDGGLSDVMLFTSVVTAPKLERLAALNARADGLLVVADDAANVKQLAKAARKSGKPLQVLVDIEVGGGRTGLSDEQKAVELSQLVSETDGLEFAGLQGYVGNHQNTVDYDARCKRGRDLLQPLVRVVENLHEKNLPPRIVSGGGTGTHDFDYELGVLTEVQGGTYVFMDMNYRNVVMRRDDPHPFKQALSVRTTVVSAAQPGFVVTDAGIKEIDNLNGKVNAVIMKGAPEGAVYTLIGDDMGRITFAKPGDRMKVGDVVELMTPHCYQTAIMYSHYNVVSRDKLVDIWPLEGRPNW